MQPLFNSLYCKNKVIAGNRDIDSIEAPNLFYEYITSTNVKTKDTDTNPGLSTSVIIMSALIIAIARLFLN